jgi:hypothetical protein
LDLVVANPWFKNLLVGHPEVQSVWPHWDTSKRCGDGGIIDKELISHHFELLVPTNSEVWCPNANNRAICDVCKAFSNETSSSHFSQPVLVGSIGPVFGFISVGEGENTNLMTTAMKILKKY